jgi:hypothetical protein
MSLIVEDGSLVIGAESYVGVADASAYHLARGNSTWASMTSGQMEEALRRAADYMVATYRMRWKGYRKDVTQSLDWPRRLVFLDPSVYGVGAADYIGGYGYGFASMIADNLIPQEVKNVCAEFALRAAAGELLPDLGRISSSERVGPIAITYQPWKSPFKAFVALDLLLAPFLAEQSFMAKLVRA